jgi:hypothetical protein
LEDDSLFLTKKRLKLYLGALLVLQVTTCIGFLPYVQSGSIDLRTYYTAGYLVRTGDAAHAYDYQTERQLQNILVSPDTSTTLLMFSPPYTALLFAPLSLAPFKTAFLIFLATNLLLLALTIAIMRPQLDSLTQRWRPLPDLLFLSFLPVGLTLMMGQITILLLILYCLCFIALRHQKPFFAGLLLSLALMKFQIALPIALLFLAWKQWRFSFGFLSGAVGLSALSIWIVGMKSFLPYLRSLFLTSHAATADPYAQAKYAIFPQRMPNLYGLFISLSPGAHWGMLLTVAASILLIAWAFFQRPSLPLALLVGMLVSYHLYFCDLALLLLPISLIANSMLGEDRPDTLRQVPSGRYKTAEWRRLAANCSVGFLLLAPIGRFVIASDLIYLFAVPIAILALCQIEWPPLYSSPAPQEVAQLQSAQ